MPPIVTVRPLAALLGLLVCGAAAAQVDKLVPVTDAMLENPDPADWLMWRRTLNHWGYSPLEQINRSNVKRTSGPASRSNGWPEYS